MATKHFVLNPEIKRLTREQLAQIEQEKAQVADSYWKNRESAAREVFDKMPPLKHTHGRVVVKADLQYKNQTVLADGTKIRLERQFNNFNRRITEPVNAIVISGENIEQGAEILIGHNALHDSYKIFSYPSPHPDVQYFSIPEEECYAWRDKEGKMQPMKGFDFALRVFQPYGGLIQGIEPTLLKDVLYMTTGELKGKVVLTVKAADYQIIFQGLDGREDTLIRCRHYPNENNEKEEIMAISDELTEQLNKGKLLVGYSTSDAKTIFHENTSIKRRGQRQ